MKVSHLVTAAECDALAAAAQDRGSRRIAECWSELADAARAEAAAEARAVWARVLEVEARNV